MDATRRSMQMAGPRSIARQPDPHAPSQTARQTPEPSDTAYRQRELPRVPDCVQSHALLADGFVLPAPCQP